MKVTIVGAGNVGASCAEYILLKEIVDEIVLLDIKDGFAEGKALDLTQTTSTLGFKSKVTGVTNDYESTSSSDVVVITSGIPRKPGMTREELIGINAGIVKSVSENLLNYSPEAIIIVVSNPMDTMTYLVNKSFDIPKNRVIGMGGILDSSRFKTYISLATNFSQHDIDAMVIGGHGDTTMIPLTSISKCNNKLLSEIVSNDILQKISSDTMVGGATLTKLLGTSAWYAPGASVSYLVNAIVNDTKEILPCSVYLEGEYNADDLCIGVPVIIGKNGFEEVVNLDINKNEIGTDQVQGGSTTAIVASIESGDFDITQQRASSGQQTGVATFRGDGEFLMKIRRFIPDFISQTGNTQITFLLRDFPNDTQTSSALGPFTVSSSTKKVDTRARARAVALKIANTTTNQSWKLGTFRLDIQPDGRR